jgi:predicted NAD/FAD-binding protein
MACALWSSPASTVLDFPARHLVRFMHQHQMLQVSGRPAWRVVRGGASQYIRALERDWRVDVRLSTPVRRVVRDVEGVEVQFDGGPRRFDAIVMACHSDQALALLGDADETERAVLGAIPYQANDTVLHTDASLLPRHRKAWAAWNAHVPVDAADACTVSYWMNALQSLEVGTPLIVTLNRTADIDPAKILARMAYTHPVFTREAVAAQALRPSIQGRARTWYAGAYWGWGFHEDGMRSAVEVAQSLGVRWCVEGTGAPVPDPVDVASREAA